MDAFQALGEESGGDGAGRKTFAPERFVRQGELIDLRRVRNRVDAGDFAYAMGRNLGFYAQAFLE